MDHNLFTAFKAASFPCNPIPFAVALADGVKANGTAWIETPEARSLLHILNSQSHGQLYQLDGFVEYQLLNKLL
jgi:hypothetical protein